MTLTHGGRLDESQRITNLHFERLRHKDRGRRTRFAGGASPRTGRDKGTGANASEALSRGRGRGKSTGLDPSRTEAYG